MDGLIVKVLGLLLCAFIVQTECENITARLGSVVLLKCSGKGSTNWRHLNQLSADVPLEKPGKMRHRRIWVTAEGHLLISHLTKNDTRFTCEKISGGKENIEIDVRDAANCSVAGGRNIVVGEYALTDCYCDAKHTGPDCSIVFDKDGWISAVCWVVVLCMVAMVMFFRFRTNTCRTVQAVDLTPMWVHILAHEQLQKEKQAQLVAKGGNRASTVVSESTQGDSAPNQDTPKHKHKASAPLADDKTQLLDLDKESPAKRV